MEINRILADRRNVFGEQFVLGTIDMWADWYSLVRSWLTALHKSMCWKMGCISSLGGSMEKVPKI